MLKTQQPPSSLKFLRKPKEVFNDHPWIRIVLRLLRDCQIDGGRFAAVLQTKCKHARQDLQETKQHTRVASQHDATHNTCRVKFANTIMVDCGVQSLISQRIANTDLWMLKTRQSASNLISLRNPRTSWKISRTQKQIMLRRCVIVKWIGDSWQRSCNQNEYMLESICKKTTCPLQRFTARRWSQHMSDHIGKYDKSPWCAIYFATNFEQIPLEIENATSAFEPKIPSQATKGCLWRLPVNTRYASPCVIAIWMVDSWRRSCKQNEYMPEPICKKQHNTLAVLHGAKLITPHVWSHLKVR